MAKKGEKIEIDEAILDEIEQMLIKGYSATAVKKKFIHDKRIRYDQWEMYKRKVKERMTTATDIYDAIGRNLQLLRLNELLVAAKEADDNRLLLDINKEIDRILSLYTQKIQVSETTYELEL